MQKPSIPKGTRDFSPAEMMRRQYIFDTIRRVFRAYGFAPDVSILFVILNL